MILHNQSVIISAKEVYRFNQNFVSFIIQARMTGSDRQKPACPSRDFLFGVLPFPE
jgi:hypothetical protein